MLMLNLDHHKNKSDIPNAVATLSSRDLETLKQKKPCFALPRNMLQKIKSHCFASRQALDCEQFPSLLFFQIFFFEGQFTF